MDGAVIEKSSSGDPIPSDCAIIEVHVAELRQLFNAIDPAPFSERDLDPRAEKFIVDWAADLPRDAPLALLVHLDHIPAETAFLDEAIHEHFGQMASAARRRLRELFRQGRISLVIGLAFLSVSLASSKLVENWLDPSGMLEVVRASLSIAGWVAMWRPMEIFLYNWWPIRAEARLFDRLAAMPVRIGHAAGTASNAQSSPRTFT